jgi:hypothetical protein
VIRRKTKAPKPLCRMDPPPRSFATDAHDCIMVRSSRIDRIQGCGAIDDRPDSGLPSDMSSPTIASVPPCSGLSRRGLETTEREALAERRPALTAPARAGVVQHVWVGTKKRASKSNKETGKKELENAVKIGA